MDRQAIKGHVELLLLSVLADGGLHGYAVVERIRARSGGEFDFPEGTVYPALHRLEQDGRLRSRWMVVDGRRRRVYELTRSGRAALDAQRAGWRRFARTMDTVIGAV